MPVTPPRTLVAFFSRAGENHHYGRRLWLEVGNTEVLVGLLASLVGVDVHPIVPAEPYPTDYEETSPRTPGNRTRTPARASPTRSPTWPATTASCLLAASGTSSRR